MSKRVQPITIHFYIVTVTGPVMMCVRIYSLQFVFKCHSVELSSLLFFFCFFSFPTWLALTPFTIYKLNAYISARILYLISMQGKCKGSVTRVAGPHSIKCTRRECERVTYRNKRQLRDWKREIMKTTMICQVILDKISQHCYWAQWNCVPEKTQHKHTYCRSREGNETGHSVTS